MPPFRRKVTEEGGSGLAVHCLALPTRVTGTERTRSLPRTAAQQGREIAIDRDAVGWLLPSNTTGIALGTVTEVVGNISQFSRPNRGSRTPRTHPLKQKKMVEAAGIETRMGVS
jgi:hypothetical protein